MLITILSVAILIIGIIVCIVDDRFFIKLDLFPIGMICCFIGAIATLFTIFGILITCTTYENTYQNTIYEKQVIEYRLENEDENTVGNELLYNDIVEFNNSLRSVKKWANNPWTNWFYNADVATIDYIEIDGLNN